ncbi:M61 family metallopeptidase [Dyadobacter frigoris]|uniref:M61 family metallopeptidase n=1 Tax=Dyadobacter frigoris TaxID=2576211 RepID=A0A4U6CYA4_9BACT|nr:PDZ domain-containing protein [Dyadobacter frigoris]TKT89712.1 M61 family metallopeptidase [Dyadobacter frigoris]GLU54060.1 peptidase M61 [Dyadobacter frigoris]
MKRNFHFHWIIVTVLLLKSVTIFAQTQDPVQFTITMANPANHTFHVVMDCKVGAHETSRLKMPAWSPGYYQIMDFESFVSNFQVTDQAGTKLFFDKKGKNEWHVEKAKATSLHVEYDVLTMREFVGTSFLDEEHGYIIPAGLCMYLENEIKRPAEITIKPFDKWKDVATGLDLIPGKDFTYSAPDFDILYDSPILIGNLEELPAFEVKGIPHRFIGYKMGDFDKVKFMQDIKKMVEAASAIIGDMPYKHYTFLAIGPGGGGIEHLNSTAVSFDGKLLNDPGKRLRILSFLTHEYFHHYNVKRIRPVELGPFNYDKGSKTNMLWVSEGLTVYYEYPVLNRAGLMTQTQVLDAYKALILALETQPGRLYQSLAQASAETWSEGPSGRVSDEFNKTISYYIKGPIVGLMLDLKIRHETNNKKSLDDVMRTLYQDFYQKQNRGFTETEFRKVCEKVAGASLDEIFHYVYTTKELDYVKYFNYAGLNIDVTPKQLPGAYLGIKAKFQNDSLKVSSVDWDSPAWKAGVRRGNVIVEVDDKPATEASIAYIFEDKKAGEKMTLNLIKNDTKIAYPIVLGTKSERSFAITPVPNPDKLQTAILKDWLK